MRQAFAWAFFKAHNVGRRTPSTPKPGHIALSPHRAGGADGRFGEGQKVQIAGSNFEIIQVGQNRRATPTS